MRNRTFHAYGILAAAVLVSLLLAGCTREPVAEKIPITTVSTEAHDLYLQSRDLVEKLRFTDGRSYAEQAVTRDEDFALGHLMMAITATTSSDFTGSLQRAVHLADTVTDAEKSMILGYAAGTKGDVDGQLGHYSQLVEKFPNDERAHNLIGLYHYRLQDWESAIRHYRKATELNENFSTPFNQLGYALRNVGDYDGAEEAFQQYIRLIPDEPNPYDSYAELLMKMGRFQESIENYGKALDKDPNFVASFIGIGNCRMFMGDYEGARQAFEELGAAARNDAERRQARFWTAVSRLHEGDTERALSAVREMYDIAKETEDHATMAGDLVLMGNIHLHAGDPDTAAERFAEAVEASDRSDSLEEVKETVRRNDLYYRTWVALAGGDLEGAKEHCSAYGEKVESLRIPQELRRHRHLLGAIALEEGEHGAAIQALEKANQQDPRVLYRLALACQATGDLDRARELCGKAASWNGLTVNFAYVRSEAEKLLAGL